MTRLKDAILLVVVDNIFIFAVAAVLTSLGFNALSWQFWAAYLTIYFAYMVDRVYRKNT